MRVPIVGFIGLALLWSASVSSADAGSVKDEGPLICESDIARARRQAVRDLDLLAGTVKITPAPGSAPTKLTPEQQSALAGIFEQLDTYSQCPGEFACICSDAMIEYTRGTTIQWSASYCERCMLILPHKYRVGLHVPLSVQGVESLRAFFKGLEKPRE